MMKKFLVTILTIVYLTVSSGATVSLHYCMGKLMSWNLSDKSEQKCGSCGMEKAGHKSCCHDEQKQLKAEKDQQSSEAALKFHITSSNAVLVYFIGSPIEYPFSTVLDNPSTHAPPLLATVPIFILNCNFRI